MKNNFETIFQSVSKTPSSTNLLYSPRMLVIFITSTLGLASEIIVLKTHMLTYPWSKTRGLNVGLSLSLHLHPYFVYVSNKGSGTFAQPSLLDNVISTKISYYDVPKITFGTLAHYRALWYSLFM